MGGDGGELTAQIDHLLTSRSDVAADVGAKLDDRLVHFRFDAFLQEHLSVGQDLLDMRNELAGLRIDDLEFLLDPEGESVAFTFHRVPVPA